MQTKEDSLLTLLEDAGLLTRLQIEAAALKAAGDSNVIDLLIQEGVLSDVEVSRTRAAQAQMEWLEVWDWGPRYQWKVRDAFDQ